MMTPPEVPLAQRPQLPAAYGVPTTPDGMLAWQYVTDRLENARNYWIATVRPDGRPHVVPVWGIWLEQAFYFGGAPTARWSRNVAAHPMIALHLEDAEQVVMVEGSVELCVPDHDLVNRIAAAFAAKYGVSPDPTHTSQESVLCLRPQVVLAWREFPGDATCWRFPTKRA